MTKDWGKFRQMWSECGIVSLNNSFKSLQSLFFSHYRFCGDCPQHAWSQMANFPINKSVLCCVMQDQWNIISAHHVILCRMKLCCPVLCPIVWGQVDCNAMLSCGWIWFSMLCYGMLRFPMPCCDLVWSITDCMFCYFWYQLRCTIMLWFSML